MPPVLFLSCFGAYLIALAIFGSWFARRQQSGDEFLLGGRSLPLFLTLGTTVATMVGTGSTMGSVGKAYSAGWTASLFGVGSCIGVLLTAWLFAPARRFRFMTMAEELSCYVGGSVVVSRIVAVFTYLACVGWLGAHILGGGFYLSYATQIDQGMAMALIAIGFAIYSTLGGYRAVVWADTIQAVVLFSGFIVTAWFAFQSVGGVAGLAHVNETLLSSSTNTLLAGVSLVVAITASILATPSFRQRIYSGDSVKSVRTAFIGSGIMVLLFCPLPHRDGGFC